jgi:GH43 family beta-xylosidase
VRTERRVSRIAYRVSHFTRRDTRYAIRALFGAATLAGCTTAVRAPAPAGVATACTFTNPVMPGADPWIVRRGDAYYLVQSRQGGIWVYRSDELTRPSKNGVKVWQAPDTGWNRSNVWAPELHHVDGRWYIYYAAGRAGPPFIHQRAGVLESATDDPQGPYVDRGMLYTGDSLATRAHPYWAIDLTVARIGGQLYAYWSGWERDAATDRTPQHLYVARMSNPYTIASNRVRISSPDAPWERGTELDLQEGPEVLTRAGHTFVIYSARESWLREYKLGQLRLRPNADPLDPASYEKSGPVFVGTDSVFGVGHASFTTSPDSTEDWIAYHSKVATTPGWNRVVRLQRFGWKPDGSPDFGTPVPSGRPIPVPSGQCRS